VASPEERDEAALLPNYAGCFVCGDQNPRGLAVRFRREGDAVVGDFVPSTPHEGYRGRVHGGVLSALLDEVMAWAPCVRMGRFCVAAEISVRFVRPARLGVPLRVRGEMTADRKRLWDTQAEIRDASGTLIARATGTYAPLSEEETAAILEYLSANGQPASLADLVMEE
jgi:uncharacterized protein (TIGR00369 family)